MRSDRQRSHLPGDALKRSQGAFLRFFSPSPLIPPQPLYQNGLKIDPRGKLLVDKMGHIGIYSEIEAQKNRPVAPGRFSTEAPAVPPAVTYGGELGI